MTAATAVQLARRARNQAAADREHRDGVVRSAREARRTSRRLRDRALHQRDRSLEGRWTFWAAGSLPGPPTFVPLSWESAPVETDVLEAAAIAECRRTAAIILRVATSSRGTLPPALGARMPAVISLCEAAASRLENGMPGAVCLLGACARACDSLERSLEATWPGERSVALSATCHASARAIRRLLVSLHESFETRDDGP